MTNEKKETFASNDNDNGLVNSKHAHPPGHLSGICHLLGPGSGEFVRKHRLRGGEFANSSGSD